MPKEIVERYRQDTGFYTVMEDVHGRLAEDERNLVSYSHTSSTSDNNCSQIIANILLKKTVKDFADRIDNHADTIKLASDGLIASMNSLSLQMAKSALDAIESNRKIAESGERYSRQLAKSTKGLAWCTGILAFFTFALVVVEFLKK